MKREEKGCAKGEEMRGEEKLSGSGEGSDKLEREFVQIVDRRRPRGGGRAN